MQSKLNRFVIDRENNVVWVDFDRDPDPPAPKFPGANGLREIGDESTSTIKNAFAVTLTGPTSNFLKIDPGQRNFFGCAFDNRHANPTTGAGYA